MMAYHYSEYYCTFGACVVESMENEHGCIVKTLVPKFRAI